MTKSKVQFTLRLDPILYTKIRIIAKEENRSVTNMLEYITKMKIKSYENEHGEIKWKEQKLKKVMQRWFYRAVRIIKLSLQLFYAKFNIYIMNFMQYL